MTPEQVEKLDKALTKGKQFVGQIKTLTERYTTIGNTRTQYLALEIEGGQVQLSRQLTDHTTTVLCSLPVSDVLSLFQDKLREQIEQAEKDLDAVQVPPL